MSSYDDIIFNLRQRILNIEKKKGKTASMKLSNVSRTLDLRLFYLYLSNFTFSIIYFLNNSIYLSSITISRFD